MGRSAAVGFLIVVIISVVMNSFHVVILHEIRKLINSYLSYCNWATCTLSELG
jgi:hypothetical protein